MARQAQTTLKIVQGGDLRRRFRRKVGSSYQPMSEVIARAQVRDKLGGVLLLDLTPFFELNPDDSTALDLFVPATTTATLHTDGVWDLFFDGQYITGGCVNLVRSVTQL